MIGIYKIENLINHTVYIGQSINVDARLKTHKRALRKNRHHNELLQNDYNKFGEESFTFNLIQNCEKEQLNELETYWCNYYRPNVYNLGNTHFEKTVSELLRKKLSDSHKGQIPWNKGIKFSEEYKEKTYKGCHSNYRATEKTKLLIKEHNSKYWLGKKFSNEHKENLSKSNARYWLGKERPETGAKISASKKGKGNGRLGYHHSPETIEKMKLSYQKRNSMISKEEKNETN